MIQITITGIDLILTTGISQKSHKEMLIFFRWLDANSRILFLCSHSTIGRFENLINFSRIRLKCLLNNPQILTTSPHRHCLQPDPSHHISLQLSQQSLIISPISGLFYFQCNQQPERFCGNMSQISWCFCSKLSLVSQNLQSAPWSSSQLLPFHLLTFCYHPQPCSLWTGHSGLLAPLEHATINLISKLVDRLFLLLESSSPRYLHG